MEVYTTGNMQLHYDRTPSATTAKKQHADLRCDCCTSYKQWQGKHPQSYREVQSLADKPVYNEVCPSEKTTLTSGGEVITSTGTIRAAPKEHVRVWHQRVGVIHILVMLVMQSVDKHLTVPGSVYSQLVFS